MVILVSDTSVLVDLERGGLLAQAVHTQRKALSLADCFALSCATRLEHTLVTGDKALRTEAEARQLTVVGLLWLLDRMADAGVERQLLHEGLTRISSDTRCRLPLGEIRNRLRIWGQ